MVAMKKNILIAALVIFPLTSVLAEVPRDVPNHLVDLHLALEECAGNGSGSVKGYEVDTFDPSKALAELKKQDGSCVADHTYSRSKLDAINRFQRAISQERDIAECLDRNVSKAKVEAIQALVASPRNLAVFSSEPKKNMKNSEGCSYFNYVIYLANGVRFVVTFDYTD